MSTEPRRVVVLPHMGRPAAVQAAADVVMGLHAAGLQPVFFGDEAGKLPEAAQTVVEIADAECPLDDAELVVVLGGDGTILRAAEVVRGSDVPLLGVNLGHVGFLAEAEREDVAVAVDRVLARDYEVEERMTLDAQVLIGGIAEEGSWALNEVSVEKASRSRSLEVAIEVDGRPLSTFGCDGVVISTPTGSTAYSFSAGGPVVWPSVDALLMVPLSAHALFSRPLVVGPDSVLAVELLGRSASSGVLWADGRRTVELPRGARIEARRSSVPVRLARLSRAPFSRRLVDKFHLPVGGWRGPGSETEPDPDGRADGGRDSGPAE